MRLFDSHAHLSEGDFTEDLEAVLKKAKENGIVRIVDNADSFETFDAVLENKKKHPELLAAVGIHPEFASADKEKKEEVFRFVEERIEKIDAIGECGLDYHYLQGTSIEDQNLMFSSMLDLAVRFDKPIVVHSREAYDDTLLSLKEKRPSKVDLHCFSYEVEEVKTLLSLPCDIRFGFNGILTFKNAEAVQRTFLAVPEDRLLLETDSPCLAPVPHRGKRNEPSFLTLVFEKMCSLKGYVTGEEKRAFAERLERNFFEFFENAR